MNPTYKAWLKRHFFTALIMSLCLIIYALFYVAPETSYQLFITQIGETGSSFYLSLFTASLSHFDLYHLAMNLFGWLVMASRIEVFKRSDLILVFFLAGIAGNLAQYYASHGNFLGLSGVTYGLVGYLFWLQTLRKRVFFHLPNGFLYFAVVFMLAFWILPFFPNIANAAHFGGFVTGVVVAVIREQRLIRLKPAKQH